MTPQKFYKDKFALVFDLRTCEEVNKTGHGRNLENSNNGVSLKIKKSAHTGTIYCDVYLVSDGLVSFMNNDVLGIQNYVIMYYIDGYTFQHDYLWHDKLWETYYLLNMIEKRFRKHFDYIILICPTFTWNKTCQEWKYINDPDFIAIECDQDKVDRTLHFVQEIYKGTNSLIILDDCASSQDVKNRTSELVKLAFSARHFGLSTIVITQQLNSISKPYRDNVAKVISFYNPDEDDMNVIFRRYLGQFQQKKGQELLKN